jgi:hypothetical protein
MTMCPDHLIDLVFIVAGVLVTLRFALKGRSKTSRQCDLCGCSSTECKPFMVGKASAGFVCPDCRRAERELGKGR